MDVDEGAADDVDVVAAWADAKTHNRRIAAINSCERRLRIVVDTNGCGIGCDDEKILLRSGHKKASWDSSAEAGQLPFNFCSDQIGISEPWGMQATNGRDVGTPENTQLVRYSFPFTLISFAVYIYRWQIKVCITQWWKGLDRCYLDLQLSSSHGLSRLRITNCLPINQPFNLLVYALKNISFMP